MSGMDYRKSGVDVREGERAVTLMKEAVRSTFGPEVLSDLGHFGGLFRADFSGMREPVLVASTDGVGTKLKVASMMGRYDTVGRDLVNHCVDDILVQGARPLFFLDYIACGELSAVTVARIVTGLADACRENGCALLGGETAEMPGFYASGDYDVAGTIVGVVERDGIVDGSGIIPGDMLLGLRSTGLHTNGYTLARKVLFEMAGMDPGDTHPLLEGETVGDALLRVHKSYLGLVTPLLDEGLLKGLAHITGGGIEGNLSRILPAGCGAVVRLSWPVPGLFRLVRKLGGVSDSGMKEAFNLGIGMVLVVSPGNLDRVEKKLEELGGEFHRIGEVIPGSGVIFENEDGWE